MNKNKYQRHEQYVKRKSFLKNLEENYSYYFLQRIEKLEKEKLYIKKQKK